MGSNLKALGPRRQPVQWFYHFFTVEPHQFGSSLSKSEVLEITCLDVEEPKQKTSLANIFLLVLERPVAAGFADEVLQQIVVHVGEGLRLSDSRQVVNAKLETELFQILHMKSGWTDSTRKRTTTKDLQNNI